MDNSKSRTATTVRRRMVQVEFTQPEFLRVLRNIAGSTKALAELYSIVYPDKKSCVQTIGNRIRENRGFTDKEVSYFLECMVHRNKEEFKEFVDEIKTTYIFIDNLLQRGLIRIDGISDDIKNAPLTDEERQYWEGIYKGVLEEIDEVDNYWEKEVKKVEEEPDTIQEEIMEEAKKTTSNIDVDDILLRMLALNEEPKEEPEKELKDEELRREEGKEEPEKELKDEELRREEGKEEGEGEKDYIDNFIETGAAATKNAEHMGLIQTASSDPFDNGLASIPDVFDGQERRF